MNAKRNFRVLTVVLATIGSLLISQARAADAPAGTLAVLVKVNSKSITLLEIGQSKPVTAPVSAETLITGTCHDCMQPMTFKTPLATKICWVCPCDVSAAACIANKALKPGTWDQMINAMPAGTGLEVTFNTDGKPESGVKSLVINEKRVLLTVDGPGKLDAAGLLSVLKPLNATAAEFVADNKQISIQLSKSWNAGKATKLEQILQANGIKIVPPGAA